MTIQLAPTNIMKVVKRKIYRPMGPVLIQMKTYSESGGITANFLNLLLAGTLSIPIPKPMPKGASARYFFITFWLLERTLIEASSLLNPERIRLIWALPFPMVVKANIQ